MQLIFEGGLQKRAQHLPSGLEATVVLPAVHLLHTQEGVWREIEVSTLNKMANLPLESRPEPNHIPLQITLYLFLAGLQGHL